MKQEMKQEFSTMSFRAKANDYYLDLMKKEGVTVTVPDEKVL